MMYLIKEIILLVAISLVLTDERQRQTKKDLIILNSAATVIKQNANPQKRERQQKNQQQQNFSNYEEKLDLELNDTLENESKIKDLIEIAINNINFVKPTNAKHKVCLYTYGSYLDELKVNLQKYSDHCYKIANNTRSDNSIKSFRVINSLRQQFKLINCSIIIDMNDFMKCIFTSFNYNLAQIDFAASMVLIIQSQILTNHKQMIYKRAECLHHIYTNSRTNLYATQKDYKICLQNINAENQKLKSFWEDLKRVQ